LSLVVDSSVALTWCFEDERTPATVAVLEQIAERGGVAPALWPLEVLNALVMAERRKRLAAMQRVELAGFLRELPITLDHDTAAQAWSMTMRLADQHRLTLYDATYLELAQRLGLPLATLDQELRKAAGALGIPLRGLDGDA
jgi:predicted nucleic acid-binding protein